VKRDRRGKSQSKTNPPCPNSRRELYFFYEKKTGVSHFHVKAGPDGQFPVEEAAGLLAMHCIVRGQSPADYVVMVEAAHADLANLAEKTANLLRAGYSVPRSVKITRREEEVLSGVMRSQANKEIAASLNMSERTVKFHVSSLLAKFHVRGRMELAFKAVSDSSTETVPQPLATREARGYAQAPSYHNTARAVPIALTNVLDRTGIASVPEKIFPHRAGPAKASQMDHTTR
jgi:DNA-binding CsgD family transcriptional regulator